MLLTCSRLFTGGQEQEKCKNAGAGDVRGCSKLTLILSTAAQDDCSPEQEAGATGAIPLYPHPPEQACPPHCEGGPAGPGLPGGSVRRDA